MGEIIILLLIGLVAGVASGVLGIGGGILVIPALVFFLNYSQKSAQGTSPSSSSNRLACGAQLLQCRLCEFKSRRYYGYNFFDWQLFFIQVCS